MNNNTIVNPQEISITDTYFKLSFESNTGTAAFKIRDDHNGAHRFEFAQSGKLGINTSPSEALDVEGNIIASGEITAYSSSDERLKTNIQDFSASELLSKMNPVTFNWNEKAVELNSSKDTNTNNFGLIAQELEEIAPELVHNIYNSDYKAIDYEKIIPILIQGYKEQQREIERLKRK